MAVGILRSDPSGICVFRNAIPSASAHDDCFLFCFDSAS